MYSRHIVICLLWVMTYSSIHHHLLYDKLFWVLALLKWLEFLNHLMTQIPSLLHSLPENSMLLSGSEMPPQRLKSPCGTRIRKMRILQMDHNMQRRLRQLVKLCSVLKSGRNSCAISSEPLQLILPHWSKDLPQIYSILAVYWLAILIPCFCDFSFFVFFLVVRVSCATV